MRRLVLATALLVCVTTTGCSTIYFHNGSGRDVGVGPDRFHHIMLGGIEVVDPVDLNDRCKGRDWKTVKTEQTFLTGLVRNLVAPIYTPWGVAWKCAP